MEGERIGKLARKDWIDLLGEYAVPLVDISEVPLLVVEPLQRDFALQVATAGWLHTAQQ